MTLEPRYLAMAVTDAEADYIGLDHDQLARLADDLGELGHPTSVVQGVIGWLVMKSAGRRDLTAATTRSRYRKLLREHSEKVGPPPRGNSRPAAVIAEAARRSAGHRGAISAHTALVGLVALSAAVAGAGPGFPAPELLGWVPRIITTPESDGYVELRAA